MSLLEVASASLAALSPARQAHFARLGEAPELYVELMLRQGAAHHLRWRGQDVGYALVGEDRALLELELTRSVWHEGTSALGELTTALRIPWIRCFTFDPLLLGLCLECGWTPRIEGCCYRDLTDTDGGALPPPLVFRPAVASDIDAIMPHREGVFDDEAQVGEWIGRGWVSVLAPSAGRSSGAGWVGVGLESPVWEHGPERDVGVLVHPDHRGRGHGALILRTLKRRCLDRGLRPTAGCAVENSASRRALTRAGFASQHRLLLFSPPRPPEDPRPRAPTEGGSAL